MLNDRIMMNESINEWMVEVVWMVIDGWGMMNESLKFKHIVGGILGLYLNSGTYVGLETYFQRCH